MRPTRRPHDPVGLSLALAIALLPGLSGTRAGADTTPDQQAPATPAAIPQPKTDFDPLQGVDPNGRVPAIEKPADLPNPDRWRYIPEGRIKPGNLLQRFLVSSFIAPFVFRSGDVGWGGGLAVTDIDFRTQRRQEFAGIFLSYTEKGQQNYSMVWRRWLHHRELEKGGVLLEERSFVRAFARYGKTLTRRFYGFGPGSGDSDETSYSDEVFEFDLGIQRTYPDPGDDLLLRAGVRGEFHELGSGEVGGKPNTQDVFPEIFDNADPFEMGWLTGGISFDTRDSQVNPYGGFRVGADVEAALIQRGGDVGVRYTLSGSKIFAVPGIFHSGGTGDEENPPTDTLAIGGLVQMTSGDLPFFSQPTLGGSRTLRGFIEGRFRDDALWTAGIEHRFWVFTRGFKIWRHLRVERIGGAVFYEAGAVANDGISLFDSRVRHSYGVSIRATLERTAPFRVDFGFSQDGLNVTARFGLPF